MQAPCRSVSALATRIAKRNPLMTPEQANFVAGEWGVAREDGRVQLRADPGHKLPNPVLYRRAEAEACWSAITADVLLVSGGTSPFALGSASSKSQSHASAVEIAGAGHMLHFDAPGELAAVIETFLSNYL